uniref:Uncharacterized protein n=1 Tax=Anguilla anguilla TaxID=7936 RepID=A0A0E9VPR9_ANGAN
MWCCGDWSGPDQEFTLTAVPHTCRTLTIFTV